MLLYISIVFRGVAQLVERVVWDHEVARSNRVTPTTLFKSKTKKAGFLYQKACFLLVKKFGFFEVLADNFKMNEVLFACNATPEKYDVWFLAHSNWNGSKTTNWNNVIIGDGEFIEEYFLGMDYEYERMDLRKYKRLVFVNMYDGRYAFLGVYEPVSKDNMKKM